MKTPSEIISPINETDESGDFLAEIDFDKIIEIIRKSFIWVLIIVLFAFLSAFIYLRYTKPIYESTSSLRLTIKNEKTIQGLQGIIGSASSEDLAGELEFIRSEIILKLVIEKLNLWLSYHSKGNILDNELYKSCPFTVINYQVKNEFFQDKPIFLLILDNKSFELSYQVGDVDYKKLYKFGQKIKTPDFDLQLELNTKLSKDLMNNLYFFRINSYNSLLNYFRNNLKVGIINPEAKILEITFKDYNQHKAQDIVNAIDSAYLEKGVEEKNKSKKQQLDFLDNQLEQYQDSLRLYEEQIQGFFLENKTKNVDSKLEESIKVIEENTGKRIELNKQLIALRELENLILKDSSLKEIIPSLSLIEDVRITGYVNEMHKLMQDKALLGLREKESTIRSKEINRRTEILKDDILLLIRAEKKLIYTQIKDIQLKISEVESALLGLPTKGREFNRISRLYNTYEAYYTTLLNRKTEIRIAEAGVVPEFIILSPANFPVEPIAPKKYLIYGIATATALFLSLFLIGIRYLLHNTISNQKELERITSAPILGFIPEYKKEKIKTTKLIVNENPKSAINEALRSIRTNLEFLLPPDKGLYEKGASIVLSVTSTVSGEGKTFLASNLGGIIAMSDVKVVILDFDMRKPKLHLAFDAENDYGISNILIGKKNVADCIQKTAINNLHFIASGPTPPNPSELILRDDFEQILKDLKKTYHLIIIDTPPVGLVTDGVLIMKKVDIPLYVVRANYSKKFFGKNINKLIRSNNFTHLALVLNSVKSSKTGYGYGGYYHYGGDYYEEEGNKTWWKRLKNSIKF